MNINKFIISLTSIPQKFNGLYLTIDSIINQTLKPDKIIINIPKIYNFRINQTPLIEKIMSLNEKYNNKITINLLDEDFGPGTKLLGIFYNGVIDDFQDDNTYLILIDDDSIYKPYMIEAFNNSIKYNEEINNIVNIEAASFFCYNVDGIVVGQGADGFFN